MRPPARATRLPWPLVLTLGLFFPGGCTQSTEPHLDPHISDETIGTGFFHSCGLTTSGAAYCWGGYEATDVATGRQAKIQAIPTLIPGGLAFRQLSAGGRYTCGLTSAGAACAGE
jgi:hypothetical protein